jgi:hypothetical protein
MRRFRNLLFVGLLLIAAFMVCMALGGCYSPNAVMRDEDSPKEDVGGRFLSDNDLYSFETVTDAKTGVVYLIWKSDAANNSKGGITVLVHEDGTPVISEEVEK